MVHLEPSEHELLGREVASAELVVGDQTPDQTQNQLHVPVLDVRVAWKQILLYVSGLLCFSKLVKVTGTSSSEAQKLLNIGASL